MTTAITEAFSSGGLLPINTDLGIQLESGNTFLPRIMLMQATSKAVQEQKAGSGTYQLVERDNVTDLGKEVHIIPIGYRATAMDTSEEGKVKSCHDVKDPEFARIQAKSAEANSGCFFGPEYLCWIPHLERYATFLMGSATMRNESGNLTALLKGAKAATLKCKLIKGKKNAWWGPVITPCSAELKLFDVAEARHQQEMFNAAKSNVQAPDGGAMVKAEETSGRE